MSIYETTIKNPKKIAEFYKQLSEQKDIEIKQLKEKIEASEKARKEAIELIYETDIFTWDHIMFNKLSKTLDIDKGKMKDE